MNLCGGLKRILRMNYLSQCTWSHVDLLGIHKLCVPKCVYSCISCIEPLFLVSAMLHNDESCRDLMTAVVDFMFFPQFAWLHSRIKLRLQLSQSVSQTRPCYRDLTLRRAHLTPRSFLFYCSLFCFQEDKIENKEICSICCTIIPTEGWYFFSPVTKLKTSRTTWQSYRA